MSEEVVAAQRGMLVEGSALHSAQQSPPPSESAVLCWARPTAHLSCDGSVESGTDRHCRRVPDDDALHALVRADALQRLLYIRHRGALPLCGNGTPYRQNCLVIQYNFSARVRGRLTACSVRHSPLTLSHSRVQGCRRQNCRRSCAARSGVNLCKEMGKQRHIQVSERRSIASAGAQGRGSALGTWAGPLSHSRIDTR